MRAYRLHAYGGPEAMQLDRMARPTAGPGERLVRLAAASVNPIDWKIREGRLRAMLPLELPRTLGRDGAGIDAASGERIAGVSVPGRDGTHAEYAVLRADMCARVPAGVPLEAAAALGISGLSAWIPLAENARLAPGERVLVHAGAGGVGSLAIQIARHLGAEVWTTCSARNAEWCRALGAARTIDYAAQDFAALGRMFDVVLDTLGGPVHRRSAEVLKPGGVLAFLNAAPVEPPARSDIRVLPTQVQATTARLEKLLAFAAQGALRVPVEQRFPLERAAEAYELSRGGHVRGKLVLEIGGS
jgi:NADPH:quinone reductase-like Zn-dependent oxidoreductase